MERSEEGGWPKVILFLARPLWQLAIILVVFYQVSQGADWHRAVLAVGAALFIAVDILLQAKVDDARWPMVRLWILYAEAAAAALLGLLMTLWVPSGPESLLLLPTLFTYAWFHAQGQQRFEVWTGLSIVVLYVISLRLSLRSPAVLHNNGIMIGLLFGLYAVVVVFTWLFVWTLQRQWVEREESQQLVSKLQFQSEQLSRVNDQATTYANRVYDLATAEERNRIAGEIHDTVAHRLTALLVQLQGARRILESGDSVGARDNMQVSEELARESLEEVRRSVRSIRRHSGDEGIEALRKLTIHYASLTGMTISFEVADDVQAVPAQLMGMLYRVIQEGLTNAQRHGRATRVHIELLRTAATLALRIEDNGKGAAQPELGFGLSSMRNRLLQYGGDIFVTSRPGEGFALELTLPLWEGVPT